MPDRRQEEIRAALRSALAVKRLRAGLWRDLVHWGFVRQVTRGIWTIEELANAYRIKEEDVYPAPAPRTRREAPPDNRDKAIAQIVAHRLDNLQASQFRDEHLEGRFLPFKEMATWIKKQAAAEGSPAAASLEVPISAANPYQPRQAGAQGRSCYLDWLRREVERVAADPCCQLPVPGRSGPLTLTFETPFGRLERIEIRSDGALAELKKTATWIQSLHSGWNEAAAVTFLLTARVPLARLQRASVREGLLAATSRIELELSPGLAPREVASLYARYRRRFAKERDRAMTDKHLALAVFAERTVRSADLSWAQLRKQWNTTYPKWRYATADPEARAFSLQARTAWTRVTGETWADRRKRR